MALKADELNFSDVARVRATFDTGRVRRSSCFRSFSTVASRQGDQATMKVGKRISRAVSKVLAVASHIHFPVRPYRQVPVPSAEVREETVSAALSMPHPHWMVDV